MKKIALLLSLIFFTNVGFAQTDKLENLCQIFHLPNKKDTTNFIVFGTKEDLKIKKLFFSSDKVLSQDRYLNFIKENITLKYHLE